MIITTPSGVMEVSDIPNRTPGVYVLGDLDTGMSYIGSSIDLRKRLNTHHNRLRQEKHPNPRLQNHYTAGHVFVGYVIPLEPGEDVRHVEQKLLDEFHPTGKLLNVSLSSESPVIRGRPCVEETRQKLRESNVRSWQDPVLLAKQSVDAKQRFEDPLYKAQVTANVQRYWSDPVNREVVQVREKERCADSVIRAERSAHAKRQMQDPAQRTNLDQSKAVVIDGVEYPHMKAAAQAVGVTYITLRRRIESDRHPTYGYKP